MRIINRHRPRRCRSHHLKVVVKRWNRYWFANRNRPVILEEGLQFQQITGIPEFDARVALLTEQLVPLLREQLRT